MGLKQNETADNEYDLGIINHHLGMKPHELYMLEGIGAPNPLKYANDHRMRR